MKIIFNYSEQLLEVPPEVTVAHLEPRRRPALRALLLPRVSRWPRARRSGSLDLERAREVLRGRRRTSRSGSRRSSRWSTPTASSSSTASRSCYGACSEDELLAESVAGELIDTEIEIRSGRAEGFAEAVELQRARRIRLFAHADRLGIALAATGTHPWANYLDQQIIDTVHYNRLREELRWVAQRNNTWSTARTRRHQRRRSGDRRLRSPARRAAPAAGAVGQLAVPRRARHGPRLGTDARSSPARSRAAESTSRSATGPTYARLHRSAGGHRVDRRGDAAVVERSAASPVRDGRAADLRCADPRRRVVRARRR